MTHNTKTQNIAIRASTEYKTALTLVLVNME